MFHCCFFLCFVFALQALSSWAKRCKARLFICVLEELHQAHPSSSSFWKKSCRTDRSNWPFQLSPIASGGCWPFLSAPSILHFFTDLPNHSHFWIRMQYKFPMSYYCTLSYNQYNSILSSTLSQRAAKAPTFQWELPNIFLSLTHQSHDLLSAETIDASQPTPAQPVDGVHALLLFPACRTRASSDNVVGEHGNTDLSPSKYLLLFCRTYQPSCSDLWHCDFRLAEDMGCLNPLSHVSCDVDQPPLGPMISGKQQCHYCGDCWFLTDPHMGMAGCFSISEERAGPSIAVKRD